MRRADLACGEIHSDLELFSSWRSQLAAMKGFLMLLGCLFLLLVPCFSYPLCTNSRAPFTTKTPLAFCGNTGDVCCSSKDDQQLEKQFDAMNASDAGCAAVLKPILCAKCDKYSGELFGVSSKTPRPVPVLCNSTVSADSSQSTQAGTNYCSTVWDSCVNATMMNSLFAPSLKGQAGLPSSSNSTKLADFWQSKADFCEAFGGPSVEESVCFAGESVKLTNETNIPSMLNGMCLEKIGNGSYLNMVPHPDGSNRAFFSDQPGKIWLANIPEVGSGGAMELDQSKPFLDLTDEVHFDPKFGMMGLAFHPDFVNNGRLFASFTCDKETSPTCAGKCSCNSEAGCDPSKLPSDDGVKPCQYHTVIAEYSANGTSSSPSTTTSASAEEVRRIFTMGLPFTSNHGGQILFGPSDGYLYFMMGDGGGVSDPYKFAQNKKSVLGKIMRLDVDKMPSAAESTKLGLWGTYTIPKDNPYTEDEELRPEIWAMGMRNPWRCSFDAARPSYFMCADVGQDLYEEVNLITKAGNYGWSMYEGPFAASNAATGNISSLNVIKSVMGYNHSDVNKLGSAAITGGYFYRSTTDPCMTGRYLFGDLYANNLWTATEQPENSGNFNATQIPFSCAKDTPLQCTSVSGSSLPSLGYIFSYGQDNNKDIFILSYNGVYRIVSPDRCNYACSKLTTTSPSPKTDDSNSPSHAAFSKLKFNLLLLICFLILLLL